MTRPRQTVAHLPIEQLTAHPDNIRDDVGDLSEMAASIREHGVLQPLTATEHPTLDGIFVLLAGHRRLAAAVMAHQPQVPVIIRHGLTDPTEHTVVMLVENTHRRELSPVERAKAYGRLRDQGLTLTEIARRTGAKPSTVSYYLNLLQLDDETLDKVANGEVPSTHAIAAVRDLRQGQRITDGAARRGRPTAYFGPAHPLASIVRERCNHGHGGVPFGSVGCGPCWEEAIRADACQAAAS